MEIPLKYKYRRPRTKGRYKGGENSAPRKKRIKHAKTGVKSHVYGQRVMVMKPSGKLVMENRPLPEV